MGNRDLGGVPLKSELGYDEKESYDEKRCIASYAWMTGYKDQP